MLGRTICERKEYKTAMESWTLTAMYIYIYIYEHSRWAEVAHRIAILCASTEPKALSLHFVSTGHANDCTADATPQTCITLLASDKHQITRLGTVAGLPAGLLDKLWIARKWPEAPIPSWRYTWNLDESCPTWILL